ncbi:VOC family protein [Breoghania sp.]|uniref:VOC family protein n=1 Tax=Breoghania sp. TaxID=2065378 RepID=UPI002607E623|nr:VOC family protein [Breoghania sp.]MDJ0931076.1 VOC family protein [Breoghania sp.]
MIDHVGFPLSDYQASRAFYGTILEPLDIRPIMEVTPEETGKDAHCGFGIEKPEFWIGTGTPLSGVLHVAFTAPDRKTVDEVHARAMAAGARDNGAPGLRPHYHSAYYAAFMLDPDGHNIDVVSQACRIVGTHGA